MLSSIVYAFTSIIIFFTLIGIKYSEINFLARDNNNLYEAIENYANEQWQVTHPCDYYNSLVRKKSCTYNYCPYGYWKLGNYILMIYGYNSHEYENLKYLTSEDYDYFIIYKDDRPLLEGKVRGYYCCCETGYLMRFCNYIDLPELTQVEKDFINSPLTILLDNDNNDDNEDIGIIAEQAEGSPVLFRLRYLGSISRSS